MPGRKGIQGIGGRIIGEAAAMTNTNVKIKTGKNANTNTNANANANNAAKGKPVTAIMHTTPQPAVRSLYRVHRPKTFAEVAGQEYVTKTLINQIANDKIGHAYLFCGIRGTGKTSVAKIFADSVNCLNFQNGCACGECEWCVSPNKNLDVIEIDAASNNGVDAVRDLIDTVAYPPTVGRYRVYIVDEVHMFSPSAFNALLKTLEEPPSHAIFILATTEVHKLLPTVQSRCLRFDFRNVGTADIVKVIKNVFAKEKISADAEAVEQIAAEGRGSVRDALSFADTITQYCAGEKITAAIIKKVTGAADEAVFTELASAIEKKETNKIAELCKKIFDGCNNTNRVITDFLGVLKNAYLSTPASKIANTIKLFMELEMKIKYSVSGAEHFEITALLASSFTE
jgi:DNA polymerase-3 subunit gamma/tau